MRQTIKSQIEELEFEAEGLRNYVAAANNLTKPQYEYAKERIRIIEKRIIGLKVTGVVGKRNAWLLDQYSDFTWDELAYLYYKLNDYVYPTTVKKVIMEAFKQVKEAAGGYSNIESIRLTGISENLKEIDFEVTLKPERDGDIWYCGSDWVKVHLNSNWRDEVTDWRVTIEH